MLPRRALTGATAGLLVAATATWAAAASESPQPSGAMGGWGEAGPDYRAGLAALYSGHLDKAEASALSILQGGPKDAVGRQLLGMVKVRRGDLSGAVGEFDKALEADPQSIAAREERGVALARLGRAEQARADLKVLKSRAGNCGRTCPPELKPAIARVEAALAAAGGALAPLVERVPAG